MKRVTVVSMVVISDEPVTDIRAIEHRNGYEHRLIGVSYNELDSWDAEAIQGALLDGDYHEKS